MKPFKSNGKYLILALFGKKSNFTIHVLQKALKLMQPRKALYPDKIPIEISFLVVLMSDLVPTIVVNTLESAFFCAHDILHAAISLFIVQHSHPYTGAQ